MVERSLCNKLVHGNVEHGVSTRQRLDRYRLITRADLRRGGDKRRHPGLEKLTPKLKWVLPHDHKVDGLEESELIEEDSSADCHDEQAELGHHGADVSDAEDLGGDDAADADRGEPHDDADHPHDDLVNDGEELDDAPGLLSKGSENSSKCQAEEDDSKCVGSISKKRPIQHLMSHDLTRGGSPLTCKSIPLPAIRGQRQFQPGMKKSLKDENISGNVSQRTFRIRYQCLFQSLDVI